LLDALEGLPGDALLVVAALDAALLASTLPLVP
jgi:hypothetical protein